MTRPIRKHTDPTARGGDMSGAETFSIRRSAPTLTEAIERVIEINTGILAAKSQDEVDAMIGDLLLSIGVLSGVWLTAKHKSTHEGNNVRN